MSDEATVKVLRTWAQDAAAFANVLAEQDSSWQSEHFPLAGGRVVLCGVGMYVNRAIAVGLDGGLSEADWRRFEDRCEAVGVSPAFEVSPATAVAVRTQLGARGYALDATRSALFYELDNPKSLADPDPAFLIEPANGELLSLWQATSVRGWGHSTLAAVKVSDAFARAAAAVDGDHFVVVRDSSDGRAVGCASMTVRDGIATLGGMSTLPSERRRGVQAALIVHRLRTAKALGCEMATTTAAPGGASERNLLRHGFERRFLLDTYVRRLADEQR